MKTRRVGKNPGGRIELGAAILAASRVVDTKLVQPRLDAFAKVQASYVGAHDDLAAVEADLQDAQVRLALRAAEQQEVIEVVARAAVTDGQPRGNPFAAFGLEAPYAIKQLSPAEAAKTLQQLVATVQRKTTSKGTLKAAQTAEAAAQAVEKALATVEKLQTAVVTARRLRDDLAEAWETKLAALKRGARAAADDGAPGLYAALTGHVSRSSKKPPKPAPAPAPAPAAAPAPALAAAPAPAPAAAPAGASAS